MSSEMWDLEDMQKTPSILAGMSERRETLYRREGAQLIFEIGSHLNLKINPTIGTAAVFFQRFYMHQAFQHFPRKMTVLSCLFLAAKVEETPKRCYDLCQTAIIWYPKIYGPDVSYLVDEVITMESVLLRELNFHIEIVHPYKALEEYFELLINKNRKMTKEKIKKVKQMSWTFLNDSFKTPVCITLDAQLRAIAMLYLGLTGCGVSITEPDEDPCWWSMDVANWSVQELEKSCHVLLTFYENVKETPLLQDGKLSS